MELKQKLYEATENLVHQQFYKKGSDTITGRTSEIHLKIAYSGQIVRKYKDLFFNNLTLFLKGDYRKFIASFEQIKGINEDISISLHMDVMKKISQLAEADLELNKVIHYTILTGSIISTIRNIHFKKVIEDIRRKINLQEKNINKSQIQTFLDKLFMLNDRNISILYNLSYLNALAESFGYKKVARVCKIQKTRFINKVVKCFFN